MPGGRRYRTGDLARWRADGNLEFLGRIDDEVKVRGNRVSLGEVQAAMESCPGVRSAVVIAEPSDTHGTHLIGYFVGEFVSLDQLGDHLAQRLPAYMIPTSFVELNALPLTASGKVDRRALPRPGAPDRSAVAPRTPAEAALVDVFASVLRVESVGDPRQLLHHRRRLDSCARRAQRGREAWHRFRYRGTVRPTHGRRTGRVEFAAGAGAGRRHGRVRIAPADRPRGAARRRGCVPRDCVATRNAVPQHRACRIDDVQGRLPLPRGDAVAGRGVYGRVRSAGRAASRATVVVRTEPTFRAGAGCQGTGATSVRRRDRSRRCGCPGLHGGPTHATVRLQSVRSAVQPARVCPGSTVWIWSSRSITQFWTAGVLPT